MKRKKYHTVGTFLKYHTVGTFLKYHTAGTFLKYKTLQHVLSPEKENMTLSRQFLSRYTGCPSITVANTNFLYMCTKHSVARLLAIFKN